MTTCSKPLVSSTSIQHHRRRRAMKNHDRPGSSETSLVLPIPSDAMLVLYLLLRAPHTRWNSMGSRWGRPLSRKRSSPRPRLAIRAVTATRTVGNRRFCCSFTVISIRRLPYCGLKLQSDFPTLFVRCLLVGCEQAKRSSGIVANEGVSFAGSASLRLLVPAYVKINRLQVASV